LNEALWYSENAVLALKDEIDSVSKEIKIATEKLDNDAFAKAKSSNTISAYSEYLKNFPQGLSVDKATKAIEDINVKEKVKALEDSKKNATPEEKKQIDAEIDRLLGVSSGTTGTIATRMFLYGGVALVGVYVLYKVFRGNSASA
jgi:rRNA processing protein Krr1/Pno1